jgi:cytochrome c553
MVTQPAVPRLAGQSAIYLARQLHAYRDGSRKDPVMSALAAALTDEEIDSISAWYESLPPDSAR